MKPSTAEIISNKYDFADNFLITYVTEGNFMYMWYYVGSGKMTMIRFQIILGEIIMITAVTEFFMLLQYCFKSLLIIAKSI